MKKMLLLVLMVVCSVNIARAKSQDFQVDPKVITIFDALNYATKGMAGQAKIMEMPDLSEQNAPDFSAKSDDFQSMGKNKKMIFKVRGKKRNV